MGDKTAIEWAANADGSPGATWNPIRALNKATAQIGWHCTHASDGCRFCYAERINVDRFGTGLTFTAQSGKLVEVFLDQGQEIVGGGPFQVGVNFDPKRKSVLGQPLKWRAPRTVFVCSMTDLFGDFVSTDWIDKIMWVIEQTPRHRYIIVTKRAERMREYFTMRFPTPDNVVLLVSAEAQREWDERVPLLLDTPAKLRGVSVEPFIGEIVPEYAHLRALNWIITGGESGKDARPTDVRWLRMFRDECGKLHVPYFHKQNTKKQGRAFDGEEHNGRPF